MANETYPDIRDLGLIGDRRTAAVVTTNGAIVWYCPQRFDRPSLLAALLDPERGGAWRVRSPNLTFTHRRYLEDSGVLETTFNTPQGQLRITDWMPWGDNLPRGICRHFSPVPQRLDVVLQAAPDYARRPPKLQALADGIQIDTSQYLYASHPLEIDGDRLRFFIPPGELGWAALLDRPLSRSLTDETLTTWLASTLASWRQIASHITYRGIYESEVANSLRALRLLTFAETGGILAAATTALPEVVGGARNYDYRYVWLRDAGMIVSALTRAGSDGVEERRFLDYICGYVHNFETLPLLPFSAPDGEAAPAEITLPLAGYCHSQPVSIGNGAREQLQLDGYGNVLLAAKLIYNRFATREHWSVVERIADFLSDHWRDPDYGIWEEREKRQYTASKVIVACGLDAIAQFARCEEQAQRWRTAVQDIRRFVAQECLTAQGAYAAIAGRETVDVSAALFPVWNYTAPDTPEMVTTIQVLERDFATGNLYRRSLEDFDSHQEGAFLAGTLWVAQYWVMRRDFQRVRAILDATLDYANDLGLFAEEADPETGQMLGNFPQTFAHAAFIGAVLDLQAALESPRQ